MQFIYDNWSFLALILIIIIYFVFVSRKSVKEWLLYAVIEAERFYQSGTGVLKLRSVYDSFCERFPLFATFVSFTVFSKMVDDALVEMRKLIEFNKNISDYIKGEDE